MNKNAYAVIMAGGRGERFWPLSTSKSPKQVLRLFGDRSLLEMALERLQGLVPVENVFVITSRELVEPTCANAPALPPENVIGEPFGRDTAAAVALGAALVHARSPEGVFCVVTADHIIGDIPVFQQTLRESMDLAMREDILITMGIAPAYPATGFGYIEAGDRIDSPGDISFFTAKRFVEKPDTETAAQYLAEGTYFWNSGMFVWSSVSILSAFEKYHPPVYHMAQAMMPVAQKAEFATQLEREYDKLEKISVDYAVMEKAENIIMARGTFAWSDVGSWTALADHFDADAEGNTVIGSCRSIDSTGNIVVSQDRLTALVGVDDLVVVHAKGATLVCPRDRAQDVKAMVAALQDDDAAGDLL